MSNADTENMGLRAVIAYETQHGRPDVQRVHRCGYDLLSNGKGEERHIEVKASAKNHISFRWLEQLEYDAMRNDPLWFLYIVTDTNGTPKVYEYDRQKAASRYSAMVPHYNFVFPKSDFT